MDDPSPAAVDPGIQAAYAVAGGDPAYIREQIPSNSGDFEQHSEAFGGKFHISRFLFIQAPAGIMSSSSIIMIRAAHRKAMYKLMPATFQTSSRSLSGDSNWSLMIQTRTTPYLNCL